jgi:hypothetical protein
MSQSNILADFRPALIEAARSEEKLLNDPPREGPYPTFHHCGFAGLLSRFQNAVPPRNTARFEERKTVTLQ